MVLGYLLHSGILKKTERKAVLLTRSHLPIKSLPELTLKFKEVVFSLAQHSRL